MRVTRIHHASVNTVGNLEETRRFYAETLGLSLADRPDLGIAGYWFQAGDGQVHLIGSDPVGSGIDPIGNHYCLAVDDLDAAVTRFDAAGIEYMKFGEGPGCQVFVTD